MVTQIYKIWSEIWVVPCPEIWRPKKEHQNFGAISDNLLGREYLRNATRYPQSENGFTNYGHSRTGKLNSVYFGPQMAKNRTGVLTHPTGGHQALPCIYYAFIFGGRNNKHIILATLTENIIGALSPN